jgi:hypothetical protein
VPFDSSYADHDKQRHLDSRDFLAGIARRIIRDPLSTHVIKTATRSGKTRYLVVDRTRIPAEGSFVLVATDNGLRLGRTRRAVSMEHIWGTVIWLLREL